MIRPIVFFAAVAALRADSLEDIVKRMDAAAKSFQSVSAKIKYTSYTDLLKESNDSTGEMRLKKTGKGIMGIVEFDPPDVRTYHFDGPNLEIYYPKARKREHYDLKKYRNVLDQALTLGFGTSGADLRRDYDVKVLKQETVDGVATTQLGLQPRSEERKKLIDHIELWMIDGKSYPLQEKGVQPSKDYTLIKYSDVKIPASLPDSAFKLTVPAGTLEVSPQK